MNKLNENIFHQYNKWKTGYERKENSIQMRLSNFLSNEVNHLYVDYCHISKDGKHVDCGTDMRILDEDLINGKFPFPFGKVKGHFTCDGCKELISLEGAPKEVGKSFMCFSCPNLTSLKGAPEKVGGQFACSDCSNLTSLKGAPKEVKKDFFCAKCENLTS